MTVATVYWLVGQAIFWFASIGLILLVARMILDWISFFAPTWRPTSLLLVVANIVYALTDPPIRFLRHRVPPLRFGGGMALDVGFMILFVAMLLLKRVGTFVWQMGL